MIKLGEINHYIVYFELILCLIQIKLKLKPCAKKTPQNTKAVHKTHSSLNIFLIIFKITDFT